MTCTDFPHPAPTTARPDDSILFAALELSRKSWLVATSAPGEEKVSKRTVSAGDGRALLDLLAGLREKAERRIGKPVKVVVIQEAGLDGFWLHRLLEAFGVDRRKRGRTPWWSPRGGARCGGGRGPRAGCARWSGRRARRTRTTDACRGNARRW